MAILKKIFAVFGILSVIVCVVVVPCSAFSVPMSKPDEHIYLYAPVTLNLSSNNQTENGILHETFWSFSLLEKEKMQWDYLSYAILGDGSKLGTNFKNNYIRVPNGGYKGGTSITFTDNGIINPVSTDLLGFSLPSVWAFRTLKTGIQSPHIVISDNDSGTPITVRYTCRVYSVKTRQEVNYDFSAEITSNSIPVFPADLGTLPLLQGFGNYIIFDYKCEVEGAQVTTHASSGMNGKKITIALPTNGSCGRLTPFASEYGESYVDKLALEKVVNVVDEYDLDFTNWLGGAFGWLDVELFGNFTIGGLLATVIGISLFLAFLKIFAGG